MKQHLPPLVLEDERFLQPADPGQRTEPLRQALRELSRRLQEGKNGGDCAFFGLPFLRSELEKVHFWSRRIRERARQLVVLGIGGSSLGGRMLVSALGRDGLPVHFFDNVDPETLTPLNLMDWRESFLLVISKSGNTAETLGQFLAALADMEAHMPDGLSERVAVITENPDSALGRIAAALEIPIIPHPPVGGRFSVLSVVGLLPAAVAGVAVDTLVQGAAHMAETCLLDDPADNPALRMGLAQFLMASQGRSVAVQMSYADRLRPLADWYVQLCGESLGKRNARQERHGLTPLSAHGVTDQHSLLQLFLDGPLDKQFTFFYDPALERQGRRIPERFRELEAVRPLAGHTLGELFAAEFHGTRNSMLEAGLPVRTFHLPSGDARALGALILLLEVEMVVLSTLMEINPFDQPAVEYSKVLARNMLLAPSP